MGRRGRLTARLARALVLCLAGLGATSLHAGVILDGVRARGVLRCGVSEGIAGFSAKDATGRWVGMDADFCRAVAAALGNPEKVAFVPLTAAGRFPALQTGTIDLLVRQTTWTLAREIGLKVRFAGVLLHDGQAFMVARQDPARTPAALDGATVCVAKGTTHADGLAEYFASRHLKVQPLVIEASNDLSAAFFAGRCRAVTSDASQLASIRASAPGGPDAWVILDQRISKEPLGPAVRAGDEDWVTLVRWVLFVLIAAEEHGITRANVATRMRDPAALRVIGAADEFSKALGIPPGWAPRVIQSVGNYGEMFERNLGSASPIKLERGPNRPWNQGGLLFAPPLR